MKRLIAAAAVALVVAAAPAGAEEYPIVDVKDCPPGYVGYVVAVVDRDLVRFCIPWGP